MGILDPGICDAAEAPRMDFSFFVCCVVWLGSCGSLRIACGVDCELFFWRVVEVVLFVLVFVMV